MTSKPTVLAFQPAPRPQPRLNPEQTRELAEATSDLGFGRTTSAPAGSPSAPPAPAAPPAAEPAEPAAPATTTATPVPEPAPSASAAPAIRPAPPERQATLKVAMDDETWTALRHEALNRRVTVKYLVMEALAEKGYAVDLSKVAEDGRRLR
jgi:hypothetical protein